MIRARTGAASSPATVSAHRLVNRRGDEVVLLDAGARIASMRLQLDDGPRDVILSYPDARDFLEDRYFLGGTIGRFANRIRNSTFELDGERVTLARNEGPHQLHGGPDGFHTRRWNIEPGAGQKQVAYRLRSSDGDQGYPGNVDARVQFDWSDDRELDIRYAVTTDRTTHVNLTNHAYFNLGAGARDVLDHRIAINAGHYTELDGASLPTGAVLPLAGSELDLRTPKAVRDLVEGRDARLRAARGADFNYVLSGDSPAATLLSPDGDLELAVHTSCPGIQLYTGQFLAAPFAPYAGLCLETQYFPDTPNQPAFPSTRLGPGQTWRETTSFRFLAR